MAFPAAATAGSTTTTFSLTGGALSISVPASPVSLGSAATGATTLSGQLGNVTVTDNRGVLLGSWTSQVSASNFTTGGGSAPETIPVGNVDYWSGLATSVTGTMTPVPGQLTVANEIALSTSASTAFSATGVIGNNSASWNPTLVVSIPSAAVAGTYTGTVTHTVS
jgi:hypothetical protein